MGKPGARSRSKVPDFLSEGQVATLMQKIPVPDKEYRMAYRLMLMGLLRVTEVCKLRVRDIDSEHCSIKVVESKSGDRIVYVSPDFIGEVVKHAEGRDRAQHVVQNRRSRAFTRHALHSKLLKYAAAAGLTREELGFPMHCHVLRHTGARMYLKMGKVNVEDLRGMLGHQNLATTSIYLKTLGEEVRKKLVDGGIEKLVGA